MRNKLKVYVDIETTATVAGAGIWQIGIVARIGPTSSEEMSWLVKPHKDATIDPATIKWLHDNGLGDKYQEAQDEGDELVIALASLCSFINKVRSEYYTHNIRALSTRDTESWYSWGCFDFPLLNYWYKQLEVDPLWHYGSEVDLRSVMNYMRDNMSMPEDFNPYLDPLHPHDALSDAFALQRMEESLSDILKGHSNDPTGNWW